MQTQDKGKTSLLSKIICPSVSSPREFCLSDGFGSVSRMRLPVLLSKIMSRRASVARAAG